MKKAIFYILLSVCIVLAGAFIANERNRYSLFNSSGEIRSGGKFGVSVGQDINAARTVLIANGYREALNPDELKNNGYGNLNRVYFLDTGWRKGTVWLGKSNNSVAVIGWNYQFGAP